MAGNIYHSWNGTVLTITSDSGSSSCDLKGATGDTGIRGPQGPKGEKGNGIDSVNGQIGDVVLTYEDVGALPDTYVPPVTKVNSKTGEVTLTYEDVGASPAVHSHLQPRNLLDNGDFSQLIAQAGLNETHGSTAYIADRWISADASATQQNGYTALSTTAKSGRISQKLPDALAGKTVTAAAKVSGNSIMYCGIYYNQDSASKSITISVSAPNGIIMKSGTIPADATDIEFRIYIAYTDGGGSCNVYWAALYEGSYTIDTLPPYVPKGYTTELAECQRHYYRISPSTASFPYAYGYCYNTTNARFCMQLPQPMIINKPTFLYTAGSYLRVAQNGTSKDITNLSLSTIVGNYALINATAADLTQQQTAALLIAGGVFEFIVD